MLLELDHSTVRWAVRATSTPGLELRVRVAPDDKSAILGFGGCFPAMTFAAPGITPMAFPVTLALALPAVIFAEQDQHFDLTFTVDTPYELLETFERLRPPGGDVLVELHLHFHLVPMHRGEGGLVFGGAPFDIYPRYAANTALKLSAQDWLDLLGGLQFTDVLVIENPLRLYGEPRSPRLVAALEELAIARLAYHDHRYDDAAVHARKALDALVADGRVPLAERIVAAYFGRAHLEVQERIRAAIRGVLRVYQIGPHAIGDDALPLVPVTRQLAAFVFGSAQLLVGWCAEGVA